jgi:hypothetical protein
MTGPIHSSRPRGLQRRTKALLPLLLTGLITAGLAGVIARSADAATTLGASAAERGGRYFGAAIAANKLGDGTYVNILNSEFNSVTAENEVKWDATEPSQGSFNYTNGDRIVTHATSRGMRMRGHALLWHSQQPGWAQSMYWSTADGAAIVQWTDGTGANQQFRLAASAGGFLRLINRHSGKALEVQGAATNDGANVVQYTDWGGNNQQWQLVRLG